MEFPGDPDEIMGMYVPKKGKWCVCRVKSGSRRYFPDEESMLLANPILNEAEASGRGLNTRNLTLEEKLDFIAYENGINPKKVIRSALICYYCDGTGEVGGGLVCPNCKGKKLMAFVNIVK